MKEKFSLYGASFIFHTPTGNCIDFEFTQKCIECIDCNIKETYCLHKHFHGYSTDLEVHNAGKLLERSEKLGFRFTTIVSDGDTAVFSLIEKKRLLQRYCETSQRGVLKSYVQAGV